MFILLQHRADCVRTWFGTMMVATAAMGFMLFSTGCASAKVDVLTRPQSGIIEPDFILVKDLAVTADEVKLDSGAVAKATRNSGSKKPEDLEIQLGHVVAQAFTDALVDNLRKAGIRTAKISDGYKPTDKTLIISGKFVQINQGNQTTRVLIGFGAGNGDIQALIDATQGNKQIARAMVTTTGSYKPGLLVPVAGGAAAGSVIVSSAVAGGTTALSEGFVAGVQCDAQRAAKDVAKKIVQGYINHGWASPDALRKIEAIF